MSATILVAGGGTGGHVFPGLAVAHAMRELADVKVVFAGSPRGLETTIIDQAAIPIVITVASRISNGNVVTDFNAIASAVNCPAVPTVSLIV